MLYFYFLATALLFAGVAAQDLDCNTFNQTWTRQVCNPTYMIPGDSNNPTAGNDLSTFFSSLTTLPSKPCAQAYASYYCGKVYPECNTANTTEKTMCRDACVAVQETCTEQDKTLFGGSFPFPPLAECAPLSPDSSTCSTPSPAILSEYYADCSVVTVNQTVVNINILYPSDPSSEQHIVCRPDHTVLTNNVTNGYNVTRSLFMSLRKVAEQVSRVLGEDIGADWYPCLKSFSNFWCAKGFPACNDNEALPLQGICASTCRRVVSECNGTMYEFVSKNSTLAFPSVDECNALPDTNCYNPTNNTFLGFFFGSDPPVPTLPPSETTSTSGGGGGNNDDIEYPPGGPATGGGIGAGVLIGLLLVIGVVMLIMKKQDSR